MKIPLGVEPTTFGSRCGHGRRERKRKSIFENLNEPVFEPRTLRLEHVDVQAGCLSYLSDER